MAAIPDAIRPRLGQFVRLLASDQAGEVVAAASALRRALAGVGADLHDLAGTIEQPAVSIPARRPRKPKTDRGHIDWPATYRREVRETLEVGLVRLSLTPWEREFVTNIIARLRDPRGRLTFRQAEVVDRLVAKIEGRHGMAEPETYVVTRDIKAVLQGRETEILDGLGIDWRRCTNSNHIECPYPTHGGADDWRWDARKAKAFCTCNQAMPTPSSTS